MKKLLFLSLFLVACASSEPMPESVSEDAASAESGDALLAAEADTSKLATTVEPSSDAKASMDATQNAASSTAPVDDNPFANLSDTPVKPQKPISEPTMGTDSMASEKSNANQIPSNTASETNSNSLLASPSDSNSSEQTSEAPQSLPEPSITPKASAYNTPKVKHKRKTINELVDDYQERTDEYEKFQSEVDDRELIPHEGGAFQLGLDYTRNAFPSYDFDPTVVEASYDTQGAVLSMLYFPLRGLGYGRFGLGPVVGGFWTKYINQNTDGSTEVNKKLSFVSYGGLATYEFQFWLGQLLVPRVFVGYEGVQVSTYQIAAARVNYPKNKFTSQTYGGGLSINLNRLEPKAAGSALANVGVRKFYLAYNYMQRTDITNSGAMHLLGLRFEY